LLCASIDAVVGEGGRVVLVELVLVEQRLAGSRRSSTTARRSPTSPAATGSRQTVHEWLRRYARDGLAGLIDRSSRPASCPHQMPPQVEARIVELRQRHPVARRWPSHTKPCAAGGSIVR